MYFDLIIGRCEKEEKENQERKRTISVCDLGRRGEEGKDRKVIQPARQLH